MADNPFSSPNPTDPNFSQPLTKKKTPGALMAILIICLVLGILGLLGSCAGIAGIVFQSTINEMQAQNGDPDMQAMQQEIQAMQKSQFIPNVIMVGLNFLVAPLLVLGSIGCLNRKSWGHNLLSMGLLLACFYVIVKTVMTIYIQITTMGALTGAMQKSMQAQGGANDAQAAEAIGSMMNIGIYVAVAFGVLWALVLLGFYLWSWTYLRKDHVKDYFGVA